MNANSTLKNGLISNLGIDFADIAKIESPKKAIEELLRYVGNLFECDRVYVFEKNEEGSYDCTDEWVKDLSNAKKEYLQNLSPGSVRSYYSYFHREGKLVIPDMEEFRKVDESLYRVLSSQDLDRMACEQLIYEGVDVGFFGIDNPAAERFDEMLSILGVLSHFVAIQLHDRATERKIHKIENTELTKAKKDPSKKSMYVKMTELRKNEPLAVAYIGMLENGDRRPEKTKAVRAEKVLVSLFMQENVFALRDGEFLIIYQGQDHHEILQMKRFLALAENTLQSIHIRMLKGVVTTDHYEENLFSLVSQANTKMLREKRSFRDRYLAKYHLDTPVEEFSELLELKPEKGTFKVLHQESADKPLTDGPLKESLQIIRDRILPEDRERFDEFVRLVLIEENGSADQWDNEFRVFRSKHGVKSVRFSIAKYVDMSGDTVYLCYTL